MPIGLARRDWQTQELALVVTFSPGEIIRCKSSSDRRSRPWHSYWLWAGRLARLRLAFERAKEVTSGTINLDQLEALPFSDKGEKVGTNGVYLSGDTPASTNFATGRFVLEPGKTPHAPHDVEEEVMVIESGHGEIFCDGKTTKVGPGSVMYTTPNTVTRNSPTPAASQSSSITSSGQRRTRRLLLIRRSLQHAQDGKRLALWKTARSRSRFNRAMNSRGISFGHR